MSILSNIDNVMKDFTAVIDVVHPDMLYRMKALIEERIIEIGDAYDKPPVNEETAVAEAAIDAPVEA